MSTQTTYQPSLLDHPAANGRTVTEGHARICRERGHATWTVNGVDTGLCPRCGEVTTTALDDDLAKLAIPARNDYLDSYAAEQGQSLERMAEALEYRAMLLEAEIRADSEAENDWALAERAIEMAQDAWEENFWGRD